MHHSFYGNGHNNTIFFRAATNTVFVMSCDTLYGQLISWTIKSVSEIKFNFKLNITSLDGNSTNELE